MRCPGTGRRILDFGAFMQTRHRIPTIFNLSMVDVLCCALGCVILLWLVNFREAKRRTASAGEVSKQLDSTRASLESAELLIAGLNKDLLTQRELAELLRGE